MKGRNELYRYFSGRISEALYRGRITDNPSVSEIRLCINSPVALRGNAGTKYLGINGEILSGNSCAVICGKTDIEYSFGEICDRSVYSFENEIKEGFITLEGGHRVGICGLALVSDGKVQAVNDISSLNFRIARQVRGCSDEAFRKIRDFCPCGVLAAGAPSSGKTTLLRDLCRNLSERYRISVVDERNEIAASYRGVAQNDIGPCCDVFTGYPKEKAIETAIRVMSPDILVCDEIGNEKDISVLKNALCTGVSIIASVHAGSLNELTRRRNIAELIETGMFRFIVFIDSETRRPFVISCDELSGKSICI